MIETALIMLILKIVLAALGIGLIVAKVAGKFIFTWWSSRCAKKSKDNSSDKDK